MIRKSILHLALAVFAIVSLIPFFYLICASLKTNEDYFSSLFLPTGDGFLCIAWDRLTLEHYVKLFEQLDFGTYILNSLFLASVTSVLATLFSAMGGFALAKYRFRGRTMMTNLVVGALVIPAALLLAPGYQLLFWLGMLDTYPGLIVPAVAPAFGIYLFRQSMINSLPGELLEAARIDGSGEFRTFFFIALPMVRPMMGAFLMICFLATWNNFINPQIVLQSPEKLPLAVAVAQMKGVYSQDYGMLMAGTLVSVFPVMLLFLMLQKEFVSGLTSGAVKG